MNGLGMEIKPIKNNRDYREALKEIDRLPAEVVRRELLIGNP